MSIPAQLAGRLALPVLCAPMFIVSNPDLVARTKTEYSAAKAALHINGF